MHARSARKVRSPRITRLSVERYEDRITPHHSALVTNYVPPSHFLTTTDLAAVDPRVAGQSPRDIALSYLVNRSADFGLTAADLADPRVTSQYTDADSGITHVYLRQQAQGRDVVNADFAVGIAANGAVISAGGGFVPGLAARLAGDTPADAMSASDAIRWAATGLDLTLTGEPKLLDPLVGPVDGPQPTATLSAPGVSLDDVPAVLRYTPTADGGAALSWGLVVRTPDGEHWYDLSVDAHTGTILFAANWIAHADYNVIPFPNEHPNDGGFGVLTNPHDPTASPFGWHDTNGVAGAEFTNTVGNNVDAHLDRDNNNAADASPPRPAGGANLDFSGYTFNPADAPTTLQNQNAAVVNLFYANNVMHDVLYQYGFTPVAGNFQTNNYGLGGAGNDAVQADAQDGGGTNNANFGTPVDGSAPRMQMYIWTAATPDRDSDNDNGIIAHEYGHGLSNRLTGGPANSSALNSIQSGGMGEGWSDFLALMFTQRPSDTQNAAYPVGTYSLNQPPTGVGIRRFPYSFNMATSPITWDAYGSGTTSGGIARSTAVHASGEIWNNALWDMNWLLINKYGYDSNIATGWSPNPGPANAGNKLAMRLVVEAMKLQPVNPSFTQARDAIIAADVALNGGKDLFEIWSAFARRGLGEGSSTGASTSTAVPTLSTTLPMVVASVTPAQGTVVTTAPTSFVMTVSSPIDAASLEASDLTVNGIAATGVSYTAGATTATFTFATNPVTAQGPQQIAIAASAFTRESDVSDVAAFASTFYFDTTPLSVSSTTPAAGSSPALPLTTIDVTLNGAIDPTSAAVGDLTISQGLVTAVSVLPGNTTVRFTVANLLAEGTVRFSLAAGAFLDAQGNPSAAFAGGTLTLDYGTIQFPNALTANLPLGSLSYSGSFSAVVGAAGDVDNFTMTLDANQSATVTIVPASTLRPSITVTGPGTNQTNTAAAAGANAQLSSIPISTAGTYTFAIGSAASTTGAYTIQIVLNTAVEAESNGGSTNDTTATAQSLTSGLLNLGNGLSSTTLTGRTELNPAAIVNEVEPNGTTAQANNGATYSARAGNNLYQLGYSGNITATTDEDYVNIGALQPGDVVTLTQSGSGSSRGTNTDTFIRLYTSGGTIVASDDDAGPGNDSLVSRFAITAADTYYIEADSFSTGLGTYQVAILLENAGTAPTTGGTFTAEVETNETIATANNASASWRALNYFTTAAGTIAAADTDIYSYSLTAGDVVSLSTTSTSTLVPITALLNSAGTVLANDANSLNPSAVNAYVIPTTDIYYLRVTATSGTGTYTAGLSLSSTATFTTIPPAQDLFAVPLTSGQALSAVIKSATAGAADVAILDGTGTVVASSTVATNVDFAVNGYVAPSAGTYYVRVNGTPDVNYALTTVVGGVFDAEANDSFATAQALAGGKALGAISGNDDWYQIPLTAGQSVTLSTTTPGGGTGEFLNPLDPRIELYDPANTLVGSDDNSGADGRNALLTRTAAVAGSFRVRVIGASATSGEYTLNAATATSAAPRVGTVVAGDGTVQRSLVKQVVVTFNAQVTFAGTVAAAFGLSRIGGGAVGGFTASQATVNGVTVVTLTGFTGAETEFGSLADGRYTLTVLAAQVTAGGLQLDGNGDGTGGDNFTLAGTVANGLFRLYGDSNGDGSVSGGDFGAFRLAFGTSTGQAGFVDFFDFDGNGSISGGDFGNFRIRFGTSVP